jgi:hypothetical protein
MATRVCSAQVCGGTCLPGFADCDGKIATQGCPVDLNADPNNCGACGNACAGGQFCDNGACAVPAANGAACIADGHCQSGHCCGGLCADWANDAANCGSCGHVCAIPNAVAACEYGGCVVARCDPGFASCAGLCDANLAADSSNCGACGNACPAGQGCLDGSCIRGCVIAGQYLATGSRSDSSCKYCDPAQSPIAWTLEANGAPCTFSLPDVELCVGNGTCAADGSCISDGTRTCSSGGGGEV